MSFSEKLKAQEEQARREGFPSSKGGGWLKFREGDNVFRVLTEPEMFFEDFNKGICYTDCGFEGSAKFLAFVLDLEDNKVKLAKLPYGIGTQIAEMEQDEDYSFTTFPMPFNIKVKAKNAGTKEVKYTVMASPKRSEVEPWVMEELSKKGQVSDILGKMKQKNKEEDMADGTFQAEQDRRAKLRAELADARSDEKVPDDYPEGDVNADDIPF